MLEQISEKSRPDLLISGCSGVLFGPVLSDEQTKNIVSSTGTRTRRTAASHPSRDSTSDLRCCQPGGRLFPQSFVGVQHHCALSSLSVCSGEVYLAIFLSLWGHDTTCPERSRMDRALVRAVPPERAIRTPVISSEAGRIFLPLRSCEGSACAARNLSSSFVAL